MLFIDSYDKMITSTKNTLYSRFDIKDLEFVYVILRIKFKITSQSQSHYVGKIFDKFDKDNYDIVRTPVMWLYTYPKIKERVFLKYNILR